MENSSQEDRQRPRTPPSRKEGLAFLYPGQGSQHPGMGKFLWENFSVAKKVFEEGSDALSLNLKSLCWEADEKTLTLTENTQPAILTVSVATEKVLCEILGLEEEASNASVTSPSNPLKPKGTAKSEKIHWTAGHSVGEYGALVASGVIDYPTAVKCVRLRGQLMQTAVPLGLGTMAAVVGLEPKQVERLCVQAVDQTGKGPLTPANYNCPGQIVISGNSEALGWLMTQTKKGAGGEGPSNQGLEEALGFKINRLKIIPLSVSAPFHSPMMIPAEEKMRDHLSSISFQNAKIPVIQNLTARAHQQSQEIKENLIQQIAAPVRWMESMETLKELGARRCIEVGANKVLQGLLKKIDSETFQVFNVNSLDDLNLIEKEMSSYS